MNPSPTESAKYFFDGAQNIIIWAILLLLAIDTFRAILAMLGWVSPKWKHSWIIYGRLSKTTVIDALKELGFVEAKAKAAKQSVKEYIQKSQQHIGINKGNVFRHLVMFLAKYQEKFPEPLQRAGKTANKSRYYISTMEASHDSDDLELMTLMMIYLIEENTPNDYKPDVFIVPKGGNVLFAKKLADSYGAKLIQVKSTQDKSRISTDKPQNINILNVNFEGYPSLQKDNERLLRSVIIDCNTTGGSQLISILKELSRFAQHHDLKFEMPQKAFVLFRAGDKNKKIDEEFNNRECALHRFFDFDDEIHAMLAHAKEVCTKDGESIDPTNSTHQEIFDNIIPKLKELNKLYYKNV